jgi:hypothetical protein
LELVTTLHIEPDFPPGMLTLFFLSDTTLVTIGRNSPIPVLTWDLRSLRLVNRSTLTMPRVHDVRRALVTPNNRFLVAVGSSDTICWRLDSPEPVGHLSSGGSGQALAGSADSTLAAISGGDTQISDVGYEALRLFFLPDLRELGRWNLRTLGCRDIACALAFAPDNRHLVLAGWEGVLRRVSLPGVARSA